MNKHVRRGARGLAIVGAVGVLAACGGGGGSQTAGSNPIAPTTKSMADTAVPAGFDFAAFRTPTAVRSSALVADASRFSDPSRTYVSLWYRDASGERQQLAFLTLTALQALDGRGGLSLTLPRDVAAVSYDIYDAAGAATALSGELRS